MLFPLFIYHGIFFLTETRRSQYEKAIYYMISGEKEFSPEPINKSETISQSQSFLPSLPNDAKDYIKLPFFKYWVVGFTITEGSFFIKSNLDACFELRQRSHPDLFNAFKLLFDPTRKIGLEQGKYNKFSVSSKKDIQNVINFFSFSASEDSCYLLGSKLEQYNEWVKSIKNSQRYKTLKFPEL